MYRGNKTSNWSIRGRKEAWRRELGRVLEHKWCEGRKKYEGQTSPKEEEDQGNGQSQEVSTNPSRYKNAIRQLIPLLGN